MIYSTNDITIITYRKASKVKHKENIYTKFGDRDNKAYYDSGN